MNNFKKLYEKAIADFLIDDMEIEIANKTARGSGVIGSKAITPRYVTKIVNKGDRVLNYGAGKKNKEGIYHHSEMIRNAGAIVFEYDFGKNAVGSLGAKYDIVFASNVLNVQSSKEMAIKTLNEIKNEVKPGGRAVFNYPLNPRYLSLSSEELKDIIENIFNRKVEMVGGTKSAPLWEIKT